MTKAGKVATYLVKKLWLLLAGFLVLFAVMLSVMRYALPHIDHKKYLLEDYVNEKYGVELKIGSVQADWEREGPSVVLNDVVLANNDSSPVALEIDKVHMKIDFWQSLRQRMLSSNAFTLESLNLEIDADRLDSAGESDFPVIDALKSLFLEQLQRFSLTDGEVTVIRKDKREVVQLESLSWINQDGRHQGTGAIRLQELANNSASIILDLKGSPDELDGVLYAKAEDLDISPWVSGLLSTHRPLKESRANFEVWAGIENSHFNTFFTQFYESKLAWGGDDDVVFNSGIRGGSIQAQPVGNKWHFRVDQLIFESNDQSLVTDLVGTVNSKGELLVNTVKPAPVNPFLVLLPLFTDDTADDNVRDLDPKGQLATMQLHWTGKGLDLAAKLIDVSWQQDHKIPGLDAIDLDIYWHKNQGVVMLSAEDATLNIDNLLPEDVQISRLKGNAFVFKQNDSWMIQTQGLTVDSPKLSASPSLFFDTAQSSMSVRLDVDSRPLKDIQLLLPGPLMGENTTAFLNRAFEGPGQIDSATILWQGKLADYPFNDNQGIFQAQVYVSDSTFRFSDRWEPLTDLDLTLLFENDALHMFSPGGKLGDVAVSKLKADIPRLASHSKVVIDAFGSGTGDAVAALMQDSSLSASLGKLLNNDILIEGPLTANLSLDIPFDSPDVVAKGAVKLADGKIYIAATKMTFAETSGVINFENDKVSGSKLTSNLLSQPVTLSFDGNNSEEGYAVNIVMDGTWDVAPLLDRFNPGYNDYLAGSSDWQAVVDLKIPQQGFSYRANVSAPLVGLQSQLPLPFTKLAETPRLLNVISEGNDKASTVQASLGDDVRFEGVLPHEEMQFSRAHLAMGKSDFVGMGIGFSVSANLDVVDVTGWYKAIELLIGSVNSGDKAPGSKPLFSVPERIFVDAKNLVIDDQKLSNVNIVAKQQNSNWMLDINAAEARATVNLYDDWLARGVVIEADYIRFDKWNRNDDGAGVGEGHSWNADTLPPVYFHCAQCSVLEKDLGEVTLDVAKAADGLEIRQLKSAGKHGVITANGKWLFEGDANHTQLSGTLKSDDVGMMLKSWGLDSGIKDSGANVNFDLNWDKSPMDFSTDNIAGNVKWSLTDGYLSELSDKGSRIFTVFSLNSLVRKLSLDFRDVFAKGFFYDDMSGTLTINNGKAVTDDTVIDGGAGEINIKGYTDLARSELNYNVEFTPNVTGNLPILVYFLATPPTALAALALDQMLTSAKVISNVNYKVTGTLSDPVFEEVGRDSKEVPLPAQTSPKDVADEPITEQDLERVKLEVNDG